MRLDISGGDRLHVYHDGRLVCESVLGRAVGRDDLEREVDAARASITAVQSIIPRLIESAHRCGDMPGAGRPEAKRDAWARGLRDGLVGVTVEHPSARGQFGLLQDVPSVPGATLDDAVSPPYRDGYRYGEALGRVAQIVGGKTAERP